MVFMLILAASAQAAAASPAPLEPWPTQTPGRVISTPDWSDYRIYPQSAARRDEEGRVRAELLVGADGSAKACRVLESSGFKELDSGTCELMMQMRFEPAIDASGRAVESHLAKRFNWRLTDPRPFASSSLKVRLAVANRRVTHCEVLGGEGIYASYWSQNACSFLNDVGYYFAQLGAGSANAVIEIRLDSGDNAPFLHEPWPAGSPSAAQTLSFRISSGGDATDCTPVHEYGFGARGLNNLSPCSRFLSSLWVAGSGSNRQGYLETRVYPDRP